MDRRLFNALGTAHMDGTICLAAGAWAWGLTYPAAGRPRTSRPSPRPSSSWPGAPTWCRPTCTSGPTSCRPASGAPPSSASTRSARRPRGRPTSTSPHGPGSDGALALGLLHVIFAKGWEDTDFLAERTTGADELRARAAEWPVERAAAATGLAGRRHHRPGPPLRRGQVLLHQARPRRPAPRRRRTGLPGDPLPARGHRRVAPSGRRRARAQRQHLPRPGQRHGAAGSAAADGAPHPGRQPGPARPGAGRHLRRAGARWPRCASPTPTPPSSAPTPGRSSPAWPARTSSPSCSSSS